MSRVGARVVATALSVALAAAPVMAKKPSLALQKATERQATAVLLSAKKCDDDTLESTNEVAVVPALLAIGASFAADFLTNWLGSAIKARKDGLNGTFVAAGSWAHDVRPQCLTIFRGTFSGTEKTVEQLAKRADFLFRADLTEKLVEQTPAAAGAKGALTSVYTLKPVRIDYRNTVAKKEGRKAKHVTVAIAFTAQAADAALPDPKDALAVFRHDLGKLRIGSQYITSEADDILRGTASVQSFPASHGFNVTAVVTESEEPGPALEALVAAFDSNKDSLNTLIEDTIKNALGAKKGGE